MQEHVMTLQDREFRLIRTIRKIGESQEMQDAVIEDLIREIETIFAEVPEPKLVTWLQIGKRTGNTSFLPVVPKAGAPLASDIIIEQRDRLTKGTA